MTNAYIKLSTLEYPRHIGDIAIDEIGESDFARVEWVDPPIIDYQTQNTYEIQPENIDGVWYMRWEVRNITEEELSLINNQTN